MSDSDAVNILQITDLHLFAEPDVMLKGIDTRKSFDRVLAHAADLGADFDLVIVTGDLTHDEQRGTYQAVRERFENRLDRVRIIPGNHDDRALMREIFPEIIPGDGPLTFSLDIAGWRIVGLDTHSDGEVPGRIDAAQIEWLDAQLAETSDRPAAVFLHHPPVPVNCPWMDRIALQEPQPLLDVLSRHGHLRFVCSGHVHHESQGEIGPAAFFTTPSTGVQFVPEGDEPAYDTKPAGYRTFRLSADGFETQVHRVE